MSPEDKKNTRIGCGIILAFLLLVGGCFSALTDDDSSKKSDTSSSASDNKDVASLFSSPTPEESTEDTSPASITVPDYTGYNLQKAQDAAQAEGVVILKSEDLSIQDRHQVWDRNWKVCSQDPEPGTVMTSDDTLTFKVVKTDEDCSDPDGLSSIDTGSSSSGGSDDSSTGGSSSSSGGSSGGSSSSSSSGGQQAPSGATAQCNDGTYSYSAHRRGTCSHHGGVAVWLASVPS
jgi:hypothetical protein